MIKRYLRPKYTIEQYLILFTFSAQVLGDPVVTVRVLSGDDPNSIAFAGFPGAFGDGVTVAVSGGIAGCIYEIACYANVLGGDEPECQLGIVAVRDTPALMPGDGPTIPQVATQTTPPYSIYFEDFLDVSSNASDGNITIWPLDELDITSYALDGEHREPIVIYEIPYEALDITSFSLDGTHAQPLVIYAMEHEALDVTSYALDGTHVNILLQYLNYAPEALDITSYALDGTHS